MAVNAGSVYSELILDSSKYEKALNNAEKQADIFSDNLAKIGGAIAAAFSIKAIKDFGEKLIEASASLQAMDAQFNQIFKGEENVQAIERINKQVDDLGIHADRLTVSWNKFGGQVKGAGMDASMAMEATDKATRLAADAAAYFDRSLEDTSASLASLMKGNFEAGDAIGVFTNATQMNVVSQRELGKEWKDLTEAERQWLLLNTVEKTYELNGAMGQATREADAYENVMGNLKATWQRFYATIGEPVLEQFLVVAQKATDKVETLTERIQNGESVFNKFGDAVNFAKENSDIIIPVLGGVTAALTAQMIINAVTKGYAAFKVITEQVAAAQGILNAVMAANPYAKVILIIGALVAAGIALYQNWDTVKAKAIELSDKVSTAWTNMKIWVLKSIDEFIAGLQTLLGWIPKVNEALNSMRDNINSTIDEAKQEQQTRYLARAYQERAESARKALNQIEEDTESTAVAIETTTTNTSNYVASSVGNAGKSVKETTKSVYDTVSDHLDSIASKVSNATGIIEKELELWRLQNELTTDSVKYLTRQVEVQTEKHSLLTMQIQETEIALAKIIEKYGESSEEALKYKNTLLDLKIQQQELKNSIDATTKSLQTQWSIASGSNAKDWEILLEGPGGKVSYSKSGLEILRESRKAKDEERRKNDSPIFYWDEEKGKWDSKSYSEYYKDKPLPQFARGTNYHFGGLAWVGEQGPELIDLPRGSKVYSHQKSMDMVKGISGGITQNITINSPTPLTPSEIARKNLQISRQLAMEWGF